MDKVEIQYQDLRSYSLDELKDVMKNLGEKPFRAAQIYRWLHKEVVSSYDEMTNLSKSLREKLQREYPLWSMEAVKVQVSKIDGTRKYLFRLRDGYVIESVLMKYHHGNSVCISSQVGCRMGCVFCASTIGGRVRNLEPGEMLGQIYQIARLTGERVANVVVMGTGEPLDNYPTLVRFIELLSDGEGFGLSQRSLTVSSCGIVPKIYELADRKYQITLAISLHAPNDEKRKKLMPIANAYTIKELLTACRYYFDQTGRRLTFEYSLAGGQNDSKEDALELAGLLKGINCHVNLIPVNPVRETQIRETGKKDILKFKNTLEKCGINVTIRREMGRDIDGACGQLRKSFLDSGHEEKCE